METKDRLLLVARARLANLPGLLARFESEIEGLFILAEAGALPEVFRQAEMMGSAKATAAIQAHLVSVVDRWAAAQPMAPAVAPLPAPTAEPAPLAAAPVPATGALNADRGQRVKRRALIERNRRRWPTIERDLKDASTNGLRAEAGADVIGFWWEGAAVKWAEARDKVEAPAAPVGLASIVHRLR